MSEWRDEYVGGLVSFEYGSALGAESRTGSGFPVYGSNGVVGSHGTALVAGPGIVIGRKGSAGALQWSEGDFWPIDTTYWVKPRVELDLRWIREALGLAGLESVVSSTGVPGLNRGDAYERSIPVPPLEEQRRIAEILDTIDETIQATERVIAKKGMELGGLAAHLMSNSSPFREWDERPLDEWTQPGCPITYGIVQAGPHIANGIPYIRTGDMGTELCIDGLLRTSRRIAESYARSRVSEGDIVCAIRATVGKVLVVPPELEGANLTQGTARIAPGPNTDRDSLLWALRSEAVKAQIRAVQKGTTFQEITLHQLRALVVRLPASLSDQRSLAASLRAVEAAMRTEQLALDKLRELRSGLATDLLSGSVQTVAG